MKAETLNDSLIEAMKEKIPRGVNLVNVLMNVLFIGKEAVYRRLRGEVPFTFEEASVISNSLGVSLDQVTGTCSKKNALFGLDFINYENPIDTYYLNIQNSIQIFNAIRGNATLEWYIASNVIPQVFYLDHDNLSRFFLFKWMYQHEKVNQVKYFSELQMPDQLQEIQKMYVEISKRVPSANFIWDNMVFHNLINDVRYFSDVNLLTDEEKETLKKEIINLIDNLEELAQQGKHPNGNRVIIYISNINFDASYSYLEADNFKCSSFNIYSINSITTVDIGVFEAQKSWIQSLKKYSMMISVSGEMQRIQFFERQRQLVHEL
ncbi:MAG: hypothetical protein LBQ78_04005 [Tannerellaceae bacterium]|jgi:hypothetical protein|nr:hypothetical protein [Tannerellaceae bacterium]